MKLTKQLLIDYARKAKESKGNLYITKNSIEIFVGYSHDYPRYNEAIVCMTPDSILKDNYCIYNHTETTVDKMIDMFNQEVPLS